MTNHNYSQAIAFIAQQQHASGRFDLLASNSKKPFVGSQSLSANFATALILEALTPLSDTASIQRKAAQFLRSQQSASGTWNYWESTSLMRQTAPLPDDLDDTCCTLSALNAYDPTCIDGTTTGKLATALIVCEVSPGGPYHTWIMSDRPTAWSDIDLAVNANIGRFLASQGVRVPGLGRYIDTMLRTKKLSSSYYPGRISILYFLSSWYDGDEIATLKQLVQQQLGDQNLNSLELSMLISAGCKLGLDITQLSPAVHRLEDMQQENHWPAEACYIQLVKKDHKVYAGDATLTTALALRALHDFSSYTLPQSVIPNATNQDTSFLRLALSYARTIDDEGLRRAYRHYLTRFIESDTQRQVVGMATLTAKAFNANLPSIVLNNLNLGSLNGWVAYTIYDDFLDDEGDTQSLAIANITLRRTVYHFQRALPYNKAFTKLVDDTLTIVDSANHWEVSHARANLTPEGVAVKHLPDYGDYSQLARRSWGHMLAASGVVLSLHASDPSQQLTNLQTFFHHFLIAKQLNDDAHDWEDDLRHGHLSAVVTLLLSHDFDGPRLIDLSDIAGPLRQLFWHQAILEVADLISHHIQLARQALAKTNARNSHDYLSWLSNLEKATDEALRKRQETLDFIGSFHTT